MVRYFLFTVLLASGLFFRFKKKKVKAIRNGQKSTGFLQGILLNIISIRVLLFWLIVSAILFAKQPLPVSISGILFFLSGVLLAKMCVLKGYAYLAARISEKAGKYSVNANRVTESILVFASIIQFIKILILMKTKVFLTFLTLLISATAFKVNAQTEVQKTESSKLVVVWTSDDPYLAEHMVLMYSHAAKTAGWFNEVTMIIWGPSAKMVSENLKIQEKLKVMQKDGVEIQACIACANAYGVVGDLKNLGFEVKGMGKPLSDYLKSDAKVLTF
jgi:hypothetical protein